MWPPCGQKCHIARAILGIPIYSGLNQNVAHMWAKRVHNRRCLGGPHIGE